MSEDTEHISVHTRKRYRVVLEGFDPQKETEESFTIKMSMRLRVPLPRIRHVLVQLPYAIKSDLSSAQANRLKAMIEELGGNVHLETHFVTPGDGGLDEDVPGSPESADRVVEPDVVADGERIRCPDCGWEEASTAEFCTLCLRRFRSGARRNRSLGARIPHDNPLGAITFRTADEPPPETGSPYWTALFIRYRTWILVGGAAVLLLFALLVK